MLILKCARSKLRSKLVLSFFSAVKAVKTFLIAVKNAVKDTHAVKSCGQKPPIVTEFKFLLFPNKSLPARTLNLGQHKHSDSKQQQGRKIYDQTIFKNCSTTQKKRDSRNSSTRIQTPHKTKRTHRPYKQTKNEKTNLRHMRLPR